MSRADQFFGWLQSVLRDLLESLRYYVEAGGDIWGAGVGWAWIAFQVVALFWAFMLEWANQYNEQGFSRFRKSLYESFGDGFVWGLFGFLGITFLLGFFFGPIKP